MKSEIDQNRRQFIQWTSMAGSGFVLSACTATRPKESDEKKSSAENKEAEVSPAEDLMREHGVLDRVLLIYDEGLRRLALKQELDPGVLASSAGIVRRFIEDYHEKLEENHLFPRFEKAGKLVDLVAILRKQHQAGRLITNEIQHLATLEALKSPAERLKLQGSLTHFIRMYRPHAAREDTVLFPTLRQIVSSNEYDSMGEQFEDEEHRLFGADGFEKVVDEVAELEEKVGIENLAQFTPDE